MINPIERSVITSASCPIGAVSYDDFYLVFSMLEAYLEDCKNSLDFATKHVRVFRDKIDEIRNKAVDCQKAYNVIYNQIAYMEKINNHNMCILVESKED